MDDNATNRRILTEILAYWQMRPTAVDSGPAALVALEQAQQTGTPFALVLLDARMPEMDGFTLVEQLRQRSTLADATIMMLTSGGWRGDAARCPELGIAAYLTKPITPAELWEALVMVLRVQGRTTAPPPLITRHTLREVGDRCVCSWLKTIR